MKIIEKNQNQLVFSSEIDESLANAIRRYIGHVLVMAADELEISNNDSPLYDETIAHRVGLIPLETPGTTGESSTGTLKLEANKPGIVYSSELQGKPKPVYENMPITILDKGQELIFTVNVKAGTGKEHSKFMPGLMFYRHASEIALDKEFIDELREVCPNHEIKEKGDKIIIADNQKKGIADVVEGIADKHRKKAEVSQKEDLIITLESFGQMPADKMFLGSISTLKKDLSELDKAIGKVK